MLTGLEGTRAVAHGARRRADVHEFRSRRGATLRLRRRVATPHGRLDRESAAAGRVRRARRSTLSRLSIWASLLFRLGRDDWVGRGRRGWLEGSRTPSAKKRRERVHSASCARRPLASEAVPPTRHARAKVSRMRKTAVAKRVDVFRPAWRVSSKKLPIERAREIHGGDAISAASLSSSFARATRTDSRWRPRRPRSGRASPSRGARRAASRARDARRVWRPARPTTTRPPWTCPRMRSATRRGTR